MNQEEEEEKAINEMEEEKLKCWELGNGGMATKLFISSIFFSFSKCVSEN